MLYYYYVSANGIDW